MVTYRNRSKSLIRTILIKVKSTMHVAQSVARNQSRVKLSSPQGAYVFTSLIGDGN
jgi:hypothetical protein